jgi:hypothetical protein
MKLTEYMSNSGPSVVTNLTGDSKPDEQLKRYAKAAMKRFPELAQLENNRQRNEAVKAAQQPVTGKYFFGMFGIQLIVIIVTRDWERRLGIEGTLWLFPIQIALLGIGYLLWHEAINGKKVARAIRKKINEFGTPVCIECGYLLTAITEPRCPECGEPYFGVGPADSK